MEELYNTASAITLAEAELKREEFSAFTAEVKGQLWRIEELSQQLEKAKQRLKGMEFKG